jgi:hypothetical protein
MLVPLDGPARFAAHPNHEKACFYVDLDELKGDTLLIWHERQVAFTAMKRGWRPASHWNLDDDGLNDLVAGDC